MSWVCGQIQATSAGGMKVFPGWIRDHFGLDFRAVWYPEDETPDGACAWALTHLPTGLGMFGFIMDLASAQATAEAVAEWADWSAVDLQSSAFLKTRAADLRKSLGWQVINVGNLMPPWSYTQVSAPVPGEKKPQLRLVT